MTVNAAAARCTPSALARGDDRSGTAVRTLHYLLIEQPGPWGRHALTMSRFDAAAGREIAERAAAAGTRTLVIRRPGRPAADTLRHWFLADTRVGGGIRAGTFDADTDLLAVVAGLETSVRTSAPAAVGQAYDEPLFLVCTHGRHDACCAIRGRPIAAAFADLEPQATWECSHVGGDRFAANVVALPEGLTYGWVSEADVPTVVAAHRAGRVVPGLLRGRATYPPAVQAAQRHAREALGDVAVDALPPRGCTSLAERQWEVELEHSSGTVLVRLRQIASGPPGPLTCGALTALSAPRWELLDLQGPA